MPDLDLALLLEASSLLSSSLEPSVVLDRLTHLLAKATGAVLVSLFVFEKELAHRISVYGPWLEPQLLALYPVGDRSPWRAYEATRQLKQTGKAVSGTVRDVNFPASVRAALRQAGITTFAALPLKSGGQVLGAAYVYTSDDQPCLDSMTLDLAQGLADHATVALEQARLHQALQEHAVNLERQVAAKTKALTQRNRELLLLNEVLVAVNESLDVEEILSSVAERLLDLLGVDQCSFYLLGEGEGHAFTVVTSLADEVSGLLRPEQLAPGGDLWQRLETGLGVLRFPITQLFNDLAPLNRQPCEVILTALKARGEILGAALLRCVRGDVLEQGNEFWRTLSDQLGLAIQNARLHQSTRAQAERLRILLDIGRDLNSSLELAEVLDRAVIAIRDYVADVHNCAISMLEKDGQRLHNVSQWSNLEPHQIRPIGDRPWVKDLHASRIALETGQPVMMADLWHDLSLAQEVRARLRRKGHRALLYVPILGKDGPLGLIHVNTFGQPRVFAAHEVELLQGIAAQLALALENARLVEAAQNLAAEAQARAQELDAFTYTVSHDLKSPLVNLQSYAEVFIEDYADTLDEQGLHYLRRISANAQTMAQMIEELLLLSHVDRDQKSLERVDVKGVVENVLAQFDPIIRAQGINLVVSPDLPPISGQEIWVEQLFVNLVSNAIKFMGDDHPDPQIEIGCQMLEESVLFWVSDNGIGIAEKDQERIFELFTRLHTVRREGTGLGLAIVRRVVERAGGRIWVESAQGQGSRFCFTWPCQF